jgi:hypothetical protein
MLLLLLLRKTIHNWKIIEDFSRYSGFISLFWIL